MEALLRILLDAAANHSLQSQRHVRRKLRNGWRFFVQNGADCVGFGGPLKRSLSHDHLIEDCAESENVGAMVDHLSADLLWRHVAHGSHRDAVACDGGCQVCRRLRRWGDLGEAEVENLDASVFGDEQVFWLEIAMHDAFFMRVGEAVSDLHAELNCLTQAQWAAPQTLAEGFSFQEFGYQVGRSLVSSHLKDRENVGMAQSGGGFGLDLEALQSIRFGGDKLGENFDGDVAIQPGIAGAVDLAHTAGAEWSEDFILAKLGARDQRHVRANYNAAWREEDCRMLL